MNADPTFSHRTDRITMFLEPGEHLGKARLDGMRFILSLAISHVDIVFKVVVVLVVLIAESISSPVRSTLGLFDRLWFWAFVLDNRLGDWFLLDFEWLV